MVSDRIPLVVITMAGLSQRFTNAGYIRPKYMLEARGRSVFEHSILGFGKYFDTGRFLFVARDIQDTRSFLEQKLAAVGLADGQAEICVLDHPTQGQAETVVLGLEHAGISAAQPIIVFNIDTFRYGFTLPADWQEWDGYLEVFEGSGDHWSFAKPVAEGSTRVGKTAEKQRISNYCSTGLYYFASGQLMIDALSRYRQRLEPHAAVQELYIAPLYNELIGMGLDIHFDLIDSHDVEFCGTPEEYELFLNKDAPR